MALQDLSPPEIVEITNYWVAQPGTLLDGSPISTARPLIEKSGVLREMLPYLEMAMQEIISFSKPVPVRASAEVDEIEARQASTDKRHDTLNRFLYVFEGLLAEVTKSPALASAVSALREKQFPGKLKVNHFSYEREAGAARMIDARLNSEDRRLLSSITISAESESFSLLDLTEEVIAAGKQLGALEDNKRKLLQEEAQPTTGPSLHTIIAHWVNRVTTFQRLVSIAALTDEEKQNVLGKLERMEANATARRLASDKNKA